MEFSFIRQAESLYDEMTNQVITRLRSDEGYSALARRRAEVQSQYPFVKSIFEGYESVFPSVEVHLAWLEVKKTFDETEQMERLALYCQGHADCYAYLKKIGAL
ncbi:hypothetical protein BSK47_14595 [Paenibacillus odorifer]|uniref:DUF6664 domain-containing protein n=2 Tax=Paenibacillus TaxID=44249 RepID=A0AB36JG77_9BACL|nr:hypothetical protein BSK47_14595 [Paenibacillus odorifer]